METKISESGNKCFVFEDGKVSEEWKDEYAKFLNFLVDNKSILKSPTGCYQDPDVKNKRPLFYSYLTLFLRARENQVKSLNGEYRYRFVNTANDYGIQVIDENEKGFILFSDQYGFSAPSTSINHIYDKYLIDNNEEDLKKRIENVCGWIVNSRGLGGSFLWPRKGGDEFNKKRGGTSRYYKSYYIQDRVDLTLLEVQDYYKGELDDHRILSKHLTKDMTMWLDHFEDFPTYCHFFLLDKSGFYEEETGQIIMLCEEENIYNVVSKKLLNDLNKKINQRSLGMWGAIQEYYKEIPTDEEAMEWSLGDDNPS